MATSGGRRSCSSATERARPLSELLDADEDRELADGRLSVRELMWMVREERVVHLADVVFRRTDLAFVGAADMSALEEIGEALAPLLEWDGMRLDWEIESCAEALIRDRDESTSTMLRSRLSRP